MDTNLDLVSKNYGLWEIKSSCVLQWWVVNSTYKVITSKWSFLFQKLNKKIFSIKKLYDYLNFYKIYSKQFFLPRLYFSGTWDPFFQWDNRYWRVWDYIDNDKCDVDEHIVYQAGCWLAKFHNIWYKTGYKSSNKKFHDIQRYLKKLQKIILKDSNPLKFAKIRHYHDYILSELKIYNSRNFKQNILIHWDAKLWNILFKNREFLTLIDYDTISNDNVYVELWDAFRSWAKTPDYTFDKDLFLAGIAWYNKFSLIHTDKELILDNVWYIILELLIRFIIDYFEEDFFVWDKSNFATASDYHVFRIQKYIWYYEDIIRYKNFL